MKFCAHEMISQYAFCLPISMFSSADVDRTGARGDTRLDASSLSLVLASSRLSCLCMPWSSRLFRLKPSTSRSANRLSTCGLDDVWSVTGFLFLSICFPLLESLLMSISMFWLPSSRSMVFQTEPERGDGGGWAVFLSCAVLEDGMSAQADTGEGENPTPLRCNSYAMSLS